MRQSIILLLILFSLKSYSQSLPSKTETAQYFTSKLLSINCECTFPYKNVTFDENSCVLLIDLNYKQFNEIYISNLDANSINWEADEANISVSISSMIGTNALKEGNIYSTGWKNEKYSGVVTFSFSLAKAAEIPKFQSKITKSLKRLIELCGGKKIEKDPFEN